MSSTQNEASKKVVDETRRLYSNLLSHQLNDKQLVRPTFKFIQEIVKRLITQTRILRNVFNANDFNDEKRFADKRCKIEFVQKLIDFVANHKQPVVGCVAAKIVAGLEPVKTNELLQALARIAQSRLSGQGAATNQRPRTFTKPLQQLARPTNSTPRVSSSTSGSAGSQRTRSGESSRKTSIQNLSGSSPSKEVNAPGSRQQSVAPTVMPATVLNQPPVEVNTKNIEQPNKQTDKSNQQANSQMRSAIQTVSSESDIGGKNLQQLRSNLKSLRGTLKEIAQMEDSLSLRLTSALEV